MCILYLGIFYICPSNISILIMGRMTPAKSLVPYCSVCIKHAVSLSLKLILGSTCIILLTESSMPEIRSRIAQIIAALTKLKIIWDDKNIDLSSKIRLLRSLVMSIFLYSCETWKLTVKIERKIQTVEMRSFRRLLGILYKDHITNEEVRSRIRKANGPYEELMSTVKRRKMKWYGHVTRASGLAKTFLQGTVWGGRRRGRQRKRWEDNIRDWTGLDLSDAVRRAEEREEWRLLVAMSCGAPTVPKTMG